MSDRARQRAVWLMIAAVPVTALASIAAVIDATAAAGVPAAGGATTEIRLDGEDRKAAGIDVAAMLPGDVAARCVEVVVVGAPPDSGLRVHGAASGPLTPHLHLLIAHGPPGASCASRGLLATVFDGPLGDLGGAFTTGRAGHRPDAPGRAVPYLVEVTLDEQAPDSAQGSAAHVELTWEVSATPS